MEAVLAALHSLGGSAHRRDLRIKTVDYLLEKGMPRSVLDIPFSGKGRKDWPKLNYEIGWAITNIKFLGLADNPQRGIWSLTKKGQATHRVDANDIDQLRQIRKQRRVDRRQRVPQGEDTTDNTVTWREELLEVLRNMPPDSFERLCQRLLRESGFRDVKVTGKSGDGGIDGHGIIRIGGLISFPVMFQCKRFSGGVGARTVRDFRGAMAGRADKGLILTTGHFTADAKKEATRDGVAIIDLIGGNLVIDKIKELELGVGKKMVEVWEVNREWFEAI